MNLKEVKELVREILRSDISEFELEHTGTRLRLRRGAGVSDAPGVVDLQVTPPSRDVAVAVEGNGAVREEPAKADDPAAEETAQSGIHLVTSPIVGTFYRAPSPGADPFVKIGDRIEEGTILCVVEAMKLMNEIPSDVAGEVVRIYVENSHPVEFGQKLFGLRPRS